MEDTYVQNQESCKLDKEQTIIAWCFGKMWLVTKGKLRKASYQNKETSKQNKSTGGFTLMKQSKWASSV